MQFDAVIIGAGMVGSAAARALAEQDMSLAIIESQPVNVPVNEPTAIDQLDLRVSALNRASEAFLMQLGAWQTMPASRQSRYDKMRVWDGVGTGHIQFDAIELGEPHLGHIIENQVTSGALYDRLQSQSNLRVFCPDTVSDIEFSESEQMYFIHLQNGSMLMTPMIIAADGARSFVRQWAQFDMREWDYHHHGLVCTVVTEKSHEQCAWQCFTEDGVLAFLPLNAIAERHVCSIVWSCPEAKAEQLLALDDQAFATQLTQAFENKLGDIQQVGKRAAFPLRQRHAKSYVKGGIVLLGDAAHTIHPLAGQGVNLGLMDAYVLADEIKRGLARGLPAHHASILARYERRRMPHNLTMMAAMEGFKRLYQQSNPAITWLRNWGMKKVNHLGPLKQHIVSLAMGLDKNVHS